ncbi:hypothetical protein EZV62_003456 [Acer yangbiense]|uniref:Coatomer subunit zeta n=1 Tax=Acer yangbiense TaxID=1000413 RepID=A0A5C7IH95_9ROSI|nr:hypothetical protein EZV62_003456 [Acer yangbiense]
MANFSASANCCPSVKNILLLDSEGKRVAVRYYSDDWPTNVTKLAFEKNMFIKTMKTNARMEGYIIHTLSRTTFFIDFASLGRGLVSFHNPYAADITILDDNIIVYKFVQDLHFFVTGSVEENELLLSSVLQGFFDAVTLLLRNNVDNREALKNLDLIFLCLDEIVDRGIILETDASVIAVKVAIQTMDATGAPLAEQSLTQALATAKEHLTRSLLK